MDNGWVMLRGTAVNFVSDGDSLAEEARRLGIVDYTSGWADANESVSTDRNVEIFLPAPGTPDTPNRSAFPVCPSRWCNSASARLR